MGLLPRAAPLSHLLIALSLALCGAGCGGSSGPADTNGGGGNGGGDPCATDADCGTGKVCVLSSCRDTDGEFDCAVTGCPDDYTCMPTGLCQTAVECVENTDCCAAGDACTLLCVDFRCVGDQCVTGENKDCYVGCHLGNMACEVGIWQACDAPPVTETEICDDGVDNDCDGTVDLPCPDCTPGYVRPCDTACGPGFQSCTEGSVWGPCDAPTDCLCEPGEISTQACGMCGFVEVMCMDVGVWSTSEICLSEGVCVTGTTEEQACGSCGVQTRSCDDACAWGAWSDCDSGGGCSPGDEEHRACGGCGSQTRTCGDSCTWSTWGDCDLAGGCQQGDQQQQSCGFCGTKTSTCDGACQWSEFGSCQGEGDCEPGQVDTETCGMCGTRQRTCGFACSYGAWSACEGQGVCSLGDEDEQSCGPATETGACVSGTQYRSCGEGCQWNPWNDCLGATYSSSEICANGIDEDCDGSDLSYPDEYEPNDTCAQCTWLSDVDGEDIDMTIFGSFDSPADQEDYYCWWAQDNSQGILFWTSENVVVDLTNQPLGVDGDLYLYTSESDCSSGNWSAFGGIVGPEDEQLEWTETDEDDSNVFVLRVKNWGSPSCYGQYTLRINGLK